MRLAFTALLGALVFHAPAMAQGRPAAEVEDRWQVRVGGGVLVSPDYRGSSDSRTRVLPYISAGYGDRFEATVQDGLSLNLINSGGFSAGPVARFRFGQEENDNRDLRGLGDVDAALEAGAFVAYRQGPWSVRLSGGQDVIDGHDGAVAELGAAFTSPVARGRGGPVLLSAGPRVTWASAKVNRAYFGVDARQSAASGLPIYRPSGGLQEAGFGLTLIAPVNPRLSVVGFAGYDRLMGDAADSPRVRDRGSRDQVSGGLFVAYTLF